MSLSRRSKQADAPYKVRPQSVYKKEETALYVQLPLHYFNITVLYAGIVSLLSASSASVLVALVSASKLPYA